MKDDIYPVKASPTFLQFEFTSIGPKGHINKSVMYKLHEGLLNVYNLSLVDIIDGERNDTIISNNGDGKKVILTVASTLDDFFEMHQNAIVTIFGNTPTRNRLYRMMIVNNPRLSDRFKVQGRVGDDWYPVKSNLSYDCFVIHMKNILSL